MEDFNVSFGHLFCSLVVNRMIMQSRFSLILCAGVCVCFNCSSLLLILYKIGNTPAIVALHEIMMTLALSGFLFVKYLYVAKMGLVELYLL